MLSQLKFFTILKTNCLRLCQVSLLHNYSTTTIWLKSLRLLRRPLLRSLKTKLSQKLQKKRSIKLEKASDLSLTEHLCFSSASWILTLLILCTNTPFNGSKACSAWVSTIQETLTWRIMLQSNDLIASNSSTIIFRCLYIATSVGLCSNATSCFSHSCSAPRYYLVITKLTCNSGGYF